jgi:hypothetical protein
MRVAILVFVVVAGAGLGACGSERAPAPGPSPSAAAPAGGSDQACGTATTAGCPDGTYCHWDATDACGASSTPGRCAAKPVACPRLVRPVCGCDGKTYNNGCEAHLRGQSVKSDGACSS